jgi:hypothetical protein
MKSTALNSDKLKSTLEAFCNIGFFGNEKIEISTLADEIIADSESSYFGDILNLENEALYEQILLSYDKEICWFVEDANAYFFANEVQPKDYADVLIRLSIISKGCFKPEKIVTKECGFCEGRDKRFIMEYRFLDSNFELVFCIDGWVLMLNFLEEINETIQSNGYTFQSMIDPYGTCFIFFLSDAQKLYLEKERNWNFISSTDYWADKANYYIEKNLPDLAEDCYKKVIHSTNFNARVQYAIFMKNKQRNEEAKALFNEIKEELKQVENPTNSQEWWLNFITNELEGLN